MAVLAIACACAPLDVLEQADLLVAHVEAAAHEEVAALSADQRQRDLAPGVTRLRADELGRALDDVGVEAAAQPAIRRDHDQQRPAGPASPAAADALPSSVRAARLLKTRSICCAYGRLRRIRSCARRSFDDETIFMAFVICCVDFTARTRRRMSISDGMVSVTMGHGPQTELSHRCLWPRARGRSLRFRSRRMRRRELLVELADRLASTPP